MTVAVLEREPETEKCAYTRLGKELLYQTIQDALAYATKNHNRFKPFRGTIRAGTGQFNPELARNKAAERIREWVETEGFALSAESVGLEARVARKTVLDLLDGKNVQEIEEIVRQLQHKGRVYDHRGPKAKEKP